MNVDAHEVNLDLVCLKIKCHAGPVYPTKSDKLQRNKNAWVSILQPWLIRACCLPLQPSTSRSAGSDLLGLRLQTDVANIVFLDSPAFVGFSYSNTSSDAVVGTSSCSGLCRSSTCRGPIVLLSPPTLPHDAHATKPACSCLPSQHLGACR